MSADTIVQRQPFIEERVVRRQKIKSAAVFAHDAFDEQFHLTPEGNPQVLRQMLGKMKPSGSMPSMPRTFSHWNAKLLTSEDLDFGSASIRRTCFSSTAGSLSFPLRRHIQEFIVGNPAPQEERQTRCKFQIADRDSLNPARGVRGTSSVR